MRVCGAAGIHYRRRNQGCTRPGDGDINDDLVNRAFDPEQPDKLWVMDVTEHPTSKSKTVAHSDHGSVYTSWLFGNRLRDAGLLGSMGSIGDCYDNSVAEAFFSILQQELLDQHHGQLATAIFDWIETWHNPKRRHSYNNGLSPLDCETATSCPTPQTRSWPPSTLCQRRPTRRSSASTGEAFSGGMWPQSGPVLKSVKWPRPEVCLNERTPGLRFVASDQGFRWSGRPGSNRRPQPWQGCALPTELRPQRSATVSASAPITTSDSDQPPALARTAVAIS